MKKKEFKCIECGKIGMGYPSEKRKFCSPECFHASLRKKGKYKDWYIEKIRKGKNKGRISKVKE